MAYTPITDALKKLVDNEAFTASQRQAITKGQADAKKTREAWAENNGGISNTRAVGKKIMHGTSLDLQAQANPAIGNEELSRFVFKGNNDGVGGYLYDESGKANPIFASLIKNSHLSEKELHRLAMRSKHISEAVTLLRKQNNLLESEVNELNPEEKEKRIYQGQIANRQTSLDFYDEGNRKIGIGLDYHEERMKLREEEIALKAKPNPAPPEQKRLEELEDRITKLNKKIGGNPTDNESREYIALMKQERKENRDKYNVIVAEIKVAQQKIAELDKKSAALPPETKSRVQILEKQMTLNHEKSITISKAQVTLDTVLTTQRGFTNFMVDVLQEQAGLQHAYATATDPATALDRVKIFTSQSQGGAKIEIGSDDPTLQYDVAFQKGELSVNIPQIKEFTQQQPDYIPLFRQIRDTNNFDGEIPTLSLKDAAPLTAIGVSASEHRYQMELALAHGNSMNLGGLKYDEQNKNQHVSIESKRSGRFVVNPQTQGNFNLKITNVDEPKLKTTIIAIPASAKIKANAISISDESITLQLQGDIRVVLQNRDEDGNLVRLATGTQIEVFEPGKESRFITLSEKGMSPFKTGDDILKQIKIEQEAVTHSPLKGGDPKSLPIMAKPGGLGF